MNLAQRQARAVLRVLDPSLKPILKVMTLTREPRGRGQPYEALLSAIAHQQLHGNAAQAILKRLAALNDGAYPNPVQMQRLSLERLRSCGLSEAKALAMQDLAAKTHSGVVPSRQTLRRWSDEKIIEQLTSVRGIGRWTVEMLLIFTLNRRDVLPVDDFGVREGFRLTMRLKAQPKPRELAQYGERWHGQRTYMALLFWEIADFYKKHKSLPFKALNAKFCQDCN